MDAILSFFEELGRTFRIVDAIDILLVATFLYAGLVWFQRTASRGVLMGVAALAVVYFLARGMDMYLTSLAFHTTFAVLLFILVVVFQEDLRRMFERVSALRPVGFAKAAEGDHPNADSLTEAAFKMAAHRTGALVVIKGKEPLDRHIHGGITLNGRLSQPLLYSIFDTATPGHDGAIVVDKQRVEQFAAHLPISKNSAGIAGRGTRHSAALGLAERSDALVIVVSQERGVVSVARAGALREMKTASDLKQCLQQYFGEIFPETTPTFWRRLVTQHGRLKVLALAIAVVAWIVLAYDPNTVQRTFVVPIEYRNLPTQLVPEQTGPTEARVTLSGSERNFRFLDPGSLKLTVDLTDVRAGDYARSLTDRNIRLPSSLSVYRIEPGVIRMYFRSRPAEAPRSLESAPPQRAEQ